ncbi:MAG: 50S ribosomal protein L32 [Acidimicrobiia bacterium]|nr:50S ribosomal protein L32 [bacterium]MXX02143.1 50S ribosomal protein L32 [Acidimicrobiia bacterium]MDE0674582.1 50S ribosomal protein L32 [bacterium]MXX45790.1 50S ribosomal protein L32 [Acidimicrobiia bacterium]MXY73873.1 50S ribosomal protein L32 [Acidimicrobiia bacterium]
MAVPKKKSSKMRTRHRKAAWKVRPPTLSRCPQCQAPRLAHRACRECGGYRGREIVEVE